MADKNGWAAAVGGPGGKSKLGSKHSGRSTKAKKHRGHIRSSNRKSRG